MSHITTLSLKIQDRACLKKALERMGEEFEEAKTGENLVTRSSYATTKVDIRLRKHPSMGFKKEANGSWQITGDWYDSGLRQGEFTDQLKQQYAFVKTAGELRRKGYMLNNAKGRTNKKGQIVLTATKY